MNNLQSTTSSQFDGVREIALSQLEGFTEDKASRRAFARRFLPFSVPPFLVFVGSFILVNRHAIDGRHFFIYGGRALIAIAGVCFWQIKATPISKISGRPMISLRRTDAPPGVAEMIYVDTESRTYFRRVAVISGYGTGGAGPVG